MTLSLDTTVVIHKTIDIQKKKTSTKLVQFLQGEVRIKRLLKGIFISNLKQFIKKTEITRLIY